MTEETLLVPTEWLTAQQAAHLLGVHVLTLKRNRRIPFVQNGNKGWRKYRRADLEAYLLDAMVKP